MKLIKSIMFRVLKLFSISRINNDSNNIFLTFDDGPEPGITEFVINILNVHNSKATFFCTGENCDKYPELVKLIVDNGHVLGNHTYSHKNGLKERLHDYLDDVNKGYAVTKSVLFRPPWGALTLTKIFILKKRHKIILWNSSSSDTNSQTYWERHCSAMISKVKSGDIILFHFSKQHENNTRKMLPLFIQGILDKGYKLDSIKL